MVGEFLDETWVKIKNVSNVPKKHWEKKGILVNYSTSHDIYQIYLFPQQNDETLTLQKKHFELVK
jgi:hypothetical protein